MFNKKRLFEVAKDYEIENKEFIKIIEKLGIRLNSHLSYLSEKQLILIQENLGIKYDLLENKNREIIFSIFYKNNIYYPYFNLLLKHLNDEDNRFEKYNKNNKNFYELKIKNISIYIINDKKIKNIIVKIYDFNTKDEELVEEVKILLKEKLLDFLETKIYFTIKDFQVKKMSQTLYPIINQTEQFLRYLILQIFSKNNSLDILVKFIYSLNQKNKNLEKKLKTIEEIEKNLENEFYELDLGDYFQLFKSKLKVVDLVIEEEKSIENYLKKYIDKDLKRKINKFKSIRNDIMHNKPITTKKFKEYQIELLQLKIILKSKIEGYIS